MRTATQGKPTGSRDRLLFSIPDAAYTLGIGSSSLRRAIAEQRVNVVRIGGRVLVHRDTVERLAREGL